MRTIKLLLPLVAIATCASALAQVPTPQPRLISVTGTAELQVKPDFASITISSFKRAATAVQAKRQCDKAMAQAVGAIRKLGVKSFDIETIGYSILPVRDKPTSPQEWKVIETASVKVRDLDKVAEVIDAAVLNGAPTVSDINFGLESVGKLTPKVREQALTIAREKALGLAKAAGVELGDVQTINDNTYDASIISNSTARSSGSFAFSDDSISPGRQTVRVTVSVSYYIK